LALKDGVQNSGVFEAERIGMGRNALFAAYSPAIDKKSHSADRPEPALHRPVMGFEHHS
jgi:hypothetical protein